MPTAASITIPLKVCFNSNCNNVIDHSSNGWHCRSVDFTQLCHPYHPPIFRLNPPSTSAARFADLSRNLISLFMEKYGTSLDSYVNKEFVDKLQLAHATKDMKPQFMQDIAEESGVQWNRNTPEEMLFNEV